MKGKEGSKWTVSSTVEQNCSYEDKQVNSEQKYVTLVGFEEFESFS